MNRECSKPRDDSAPERAAWGFISLIAEKPEMHDASINLDKDPRRGKLRTLTSSTISRTGRSALKERSRDVSRIGERCEGG
jgi:hypothetical protein